MVNSQVMLSQTGSVKCPLSERGLPIPPAMAQSAFLGISREGVLDRLVSSHFCDPGLLCFYLFTEGPGTTKTSKPSAVPPGPPVYLDLCYIPNHSNSKNVDVEFFKRVRSSYYVVSGNDPAAEEPSRAVLDALLEGKAQWGSNMQVRVPGQCLHNTWSCVQRQREGIVFNEAPPWIPMQCPGGLPHWNTVHTWTQWISHTQAGLKVFLPPATMDLEECHFTTLKHNLQSGPKITHPSYTKNKQCNQVSYLHMRWIKISLYSSFPSRRKLEIWPFRKSAVHMRFCRRSIAESGPQQDTPNSRTLEWATSHSLFQLWILFKFYLWFCIVI